MVHKTSQLIIIVLIILTFIILSISQRIQAVDYIVINNATETAGGKVFAEQIGEEFAQQTLAEATIYIWQTFQEYTYADRKPFDQVSLTIVPSLPSNIVADTSNNQIQYSAISLNMSQHAETEFVEIIFHEMTHVWQWYGNGQSTIGLIEGIADYMRLTAFRISVQPGAGAYWDEGYAVTARFLMYCESLKHGFVAQLNKKMRDGYSDIFFEELLGKSLGQVWFDYKAEFASYSGTGLKSGMEPTYLITRVWIYLGMLFFLL